jgi:ankyrin repeat protein
VRQLLDSNPRLANARDGSTPVVEWALDALDRPGEPGSRARFLATLLLEKGADANAADRDGDPLVVGYARSARLSQVELLVAHGARVNASDGYGRTALFSLATRREHGEGGVAVPSTQVDKALVAARTLIAAGANVNAPDKRGTTPLAVASFLGNVRLAELLIASGANVNAVDADGYSVLGIVLARSQQALADDWQKTILPPVAELLKAHDALAVRPN